MTSISNIKKTITTLNKEEIKLQKELNNIKHKKKIMENKLIEKCIQNKTHKYERDYECLSYGDTEYKCITCGLYK